MEWACQNETGWNGTDWTTVTPFLGSTEYVYQAFVYTFFTVAGELAASNQEQQTLLWRASPTSVALTSASIVHNVL